MPKKSNHKSLPNIEIPSAKTGEQVATRKELHLVRDELKSDIRSLELKMDARFDVVESRFSAHDSRFTNIEASLEKMKAEQFRMYALMEEQNSNNRIVLEGLQALWQRQDRIEKLR
jgi:hypothetical protein